MNWCGFVIGVLGMVLVTVLIRLVICKDISKKCSIWKQISARFRSLKKVISTLVFILLSPDYLLAKKSKEAIKQDNISNNEKKEPSSEENPRSNYIRKANHCNLVVSIVLILLLFVVQWVSCDGGCLYAFLLGMVAYRTLSRTVEINVSFVKDCISSRLKKSDLKKHERMILALLSLLEEACLFSGVYTFAFEKAEWYKALFAGMHSFILTPNLINQDSWLLSIISIYQVVSSIILLTIAFATYISSGKSEDDPEKKPMDHPQTSLEEGRNDSTNHASETQEKEIATTSDPKPEANDPNSKNK